MPAPLRFDVVTSFDARCRSDGEMLAEVSTSTTVATLVASTFMRGSKQSEDHRQKRAVFRTRPACWASSANPIGQTNGSGSRNRTQACSNVMMPASCWGSATGLKIGADDCGPARRAPFDKQAEGAQHRQVLPQIA